MLPVMPVVTGNAVFRVDDMVAFNAQLVDRVNLRSGSLQKIVGDVPHRARSRAVFGRQRSAGLENAQGLGGGGAEQALRNHVTRKDHARGASIRVSHLAERVVNRNLHSGRGDPLAEVAVVHFWRWDRELRSVGAGAIAKTFVGEKEKRLFLAVINFRNPDRSADGNPEIVLLVNRIRDTGRVVEEVVRI